MCLISGAFCQSACRSRYEVDGFGRGLSIRVLIVPVLFEGPQIQPWEIPRQPSRTGMGRPRATSVSRICHRLCVLTASSSCSHRCGVICKPVIPLESSSNAKKFPAVIDVRKSSRGKAAKRQVIAYWPSHFASIFTSVARFFNLFGVQFGEIENHVILRGKRGKSRRIGMVCVRVCACLRLVTLCVSFVSMRLYLYLDVRVCKEKRNP
jgi:hypothetical protein